MDRLARHINDSGRRLAFAFLLSMPGAPYIYYGDEIGMNYVEGLTSVEGGYGRTGSRSPMQWDSSNNAGFSAASPDKLYIPMDHSPDRPTSEAQMKDSASLRSEVKKLIAVRMAHKALQSLGTIEFLCDGAKGKPLAYIRSFEDERIAVIVNPAASDFTLSLPGTAGETIYSFGKGASANGSTLTVSGRSAVFIGLK